jgi:hypothetical protein
MHPLHLLKCLPALALVGFCVFPASLKAQAPLGEQFAPADLSQRLVARRAVEAAI